MIGKLSHVAIVAPDLTAVVAVYRDALGAKVSEPVDMPEHGVRAVFVEFPNTRIELLEPLGTDSPISNFLKRNPDGGVHHLCYEVQDITVARKHLREQGLRAIGDGEPKVGANGKLVLFMHPKDFGGVLVELEEL